MGSGAQNLGTSKRRHREKKLLIKVLGWVLLSKCSFMVRVATTPSKGATA